MQPRSTGRARVRSIFLVLAMLSQIAEDKQNVIFAMEKPETQSLPMRKSGS